MWDYIKRQRLQRKGLSCGKKRREQAESELMESVRSSPAVRLFFVTLFLMGLGAIIRYLPATSGLQHLQLDPGLGSLAVIVVIAASALHFKLEDPSGWRHNSRVLLVYLILLMQMTMVHLVDFVLRFNGRESSEVLLCVPCAFAPIALTLLSGEKRGFFAAMYGSLLGAFLVHHSHSIAYLVLSLAVGWVGVLASKPLRKRRQLMRCGLWVGLAALVMAFVLGRMGQAASLWQGEGWEDFGTKCGLAILTGVLTVTLVNGILPILEGIFKITTPISWTELSDLNHPLLRRMTLEAPGTYHHSLMVASLAESAAEAIGADATMCRVCSYFHDIGKLERPEYCIENIHGEENPHDDLSPTMSALIIISHVKDGVSLALKHKLNREIINVIQEHHGNSLVWFFYRRALDQVDEIKKQVTIGIAQPTDIPEISEKEFRYPGPRPQSRESAIISLADAVESASRVLQKPTPQKIEQMVEEIVAARLKDGQLHECDLTMAELDKVKESFQNRLRTMLHRRVPYPEEKAARNKGGKIGELAIPTPAPPAESTDDEANSPSQPVATTLPGSPEAARIGYRVAL